MKGTNTPSVENIEENEKNRRFSDIFLKIVGEREQQEDKELATS